MAGFSDKGDCKGGAEGQRPQWLEDVPPGTIPKSHAGAAATTLATGAPLPPDTSRCALDNVQIFHKGFFLGGGTPKTLYSP